MVKTVLENRQNLIIEGCYVPFDWRRSFKADYLEHICFLCLAMTEDFIDAHFAEIRAHASDIEDRLYEDDLTAARLKRENRAVIDGFREQGEPVLLIEDNYARTIKKLIDLMDVGGIQ